MKAFLFAMLLTSVAPVFAEGPKCLGANCNNTEKLCPCETCKSGWSPCVGVYDGPNGKVPGSIPQNSTRSRKGSRVSNQ